MKTLVKILKIGHQSQHLFSYSTRRSLPWIAKNFCSTPLNLTPAYLHKPINKSTIATEDTFSSQVLEYIRSSTFYSALPNGLEKHASSTATTDMKCAIQQMLLVVAHNPDVKVNDILKLFNLYASSEQFLMQHLISDKSLMKAVQNKVTQSLLYMSIQELQQFAMSLKKLQTQKLRYLNNIKSDIAIHCEKKALESSLQQALEYFDILLTLYGNNVYKRYEFDTFMSIFEANLNDAMPHDLVQIIHYIGLSKNKKALKEFAENAMRKLEPYFDELTFADVGIAAGGLFKVGVNVIKSSSFVVDTAQCLKLKINGASNLSNLEVFFIVSMIKLLRVAHYKDDELISCLKGLIFKENEFVLNCRVLPHIVAYYTNSRVYEKQVFSKLEEVVMNDMKTVEYMRFKDVTRILWCFSHVGHECSSEFFTQVDTYLSKLLLGSDTDITRNPHVLTDALLSLAMCGHYPSDLIKEAFKPMMIKGLKGFQRSKQLSRLLTLYECISIESPAVPVEKPPVSKGDLPLRTMSDELLHRSSLARLMGGAEVINGLVGHNVLNLKFLIPCINYATLTVEFSNLNELLYKNETTAEQRHILQQLLLVRENCGGGLVAVEVLEKDHMIEPISQPIGLVRLKLRLLQRKGWHLRVFSSAEIEQCDDKRAVAALIIDRLLTDK